MPEKTPADQRDAAQREFYERLSALVWDLHRALRQELSQRYPALIPKRQWTTAADPDWAQDGWDYTRVP